MRISQSLGYSDHLRQISQNRKRSMEKLSSGKGINRAADNAAGLSISVKMNAQVRGISQSRRNIKDAQGLLEVAESGLNEISSSLHRIRELSVQAASDVLSDMDRKGIDKELTEIKAQISGAVNETGFNTKKVLSTQIPKVLHVDKRYAEKEIELIETSSDYNPQFKLQKPLGIFTSAAKEKSFTSTLITQKIKYVNFKITPEHEEKVNLSIVEEHPRYSENGEVIFRSTRGEGYYFINSANNIESHDEVTEQRVSVVQNISNNTNTEDANVYEFTDQLKIVDNKLVFTTSMISTEPNSEYHSADEYVFDDYDITQGSEGFSISKDGSEFTYMTENGEISRVKISRSFSEEENIDLIPEQEDIESLIDPVIYNIDLYLEKEIIQVPEDRWIPVPEYLMNYRLGEVNPSFKIFEDTGTEISYWNGSEGSIPEADTYYELKDDRIHFYGAYDGTYNFRYMTEEENIIKLPDDVFLDKTEVHPRNLSLKKGSVVIPHEGIYFEKPDDIESFVFINDENKLELFGDYRLGVGEELEINYLNENYTNIKAQSNIDTYHLKDPDMIRALRVYVHGSEVNHVINEDDKNGFSYDPATGNITLSGSARPILTEDTINMDNAVEIRYYKALDEEHEVTKLYLDSLPEIYNLTPDDPAGSIRVYKNGQRINYSEVDGFTYKAGDHYLMLNGNSRSDVSANGDNDEYEVYYAVDHLAFQGSNQNGDYEIKLTDDLESLIEWYGDISSAISVSKGTGVTIPFDDDNGWQYNPNTKIITLVGSGRPNAFERVTVSYLLGTNDQNSAYDFTLKDLPRIYGLGEEEGPKSVRIYVNGNEIPFSQSNGFTLTGKQVSLNGTSRPAPQGDLTIEAYYTTGEYAVSIPADNKINRVRLGDTEIFPADDNGGNGYTFENGVVRLVGYALPDIDNGSDKLTLNVKHYPSTDVPIDERTMIFDPYQNEWVETDESRADIPMDRLSVKIERLDNKFYLDEEKKIVFPQYYELKNGQIIFKKELEFPAGENRISVDYEATHVREYEDNSFTFQVGGNSGDHFEVKLKSVENLMFTIDSLTLKSRDYADKTIGIIDRLIGEVNSQRGNIGSIQNRLESASSNLAVLEENTMSAVSRIEDADYAKEMVKQIRYSILEQAYLALQVHQMNSGKEILKLIG